jgi:diaminopimelate decarboxylase
MFQIRDNELFIDHISTEMLATKYGTPVMVFSIDTIRQKIGALRTQFLDRYENVRAAYAGKAFLPLAMCKVIEEEGLCLDVVSGGELYTALKAGFPVDRIEFNGNNKSMEEIQMAVEHQVGRIIIDGADELELIEDACKGTGKRIKALLRISPGVDAHTHQFITTGNVDSKFGIPLHGDMLEQVFLKIQASEWVDLLGFHIHIGSQLHENETYLNAVTVLLDTIGDLQKRFGFQTEEINIGGGFGVRYTDEDQVNSYSFFLDPVMEMIDSWSRQTGVPRPTVVIEPGRSIVANAGTTLYRVGAIKEIPGVRKYVSVDGGMTDNIRTALYDSQYECHVNTSASQQETVTICGKCCESGDILIKDVSVNAPKRGDVVAIFSTGAYCFPMASNYNKIPMLPVVFISGGEDKLAVRRQSYDELLEREENLMTN